ncbi:MAG: hypothetical protein QOC89_2427, partial [Paraburkholderia sp.]|nr:hypothetical protein [Paraburkholderia sp.]
LISNSEAHIARANCLKKLDPNESYTAVQVQTSMGVENV